MWWCCFTRTGGWRWDVVTFCLFCFFKQFAPCSAFMNLSLNLICEIFCPLKILFWDLPKEAESLSHVRWSWSNLGWNDSFGPQSLRWSCDCLTFFTFSLLSWRIAPLSNLAHWYILRCRWPIHTGYARTTNRARPPGQVRPLDLSGVQIAQDQVRATWYDQHQPSQYTTASWEFVREML